MKRSTRYVLLLAFCFSIICQPVFVSASGIVVEKPETIVQYQLGTIRMDVDEVHKKELTEILDGLEEAVLVEEKGDLSRGDDFISILLIRENGDKDKFFFFQDRGQWYLETDDGNVYENADFFTEIIEVEEVVKKNEAVFIRMKLLNEFDKQRRVEYMEGEDTIEGKRYSDFTFYEKAYLETYVYQK